ncbi:cysteine protease [Candidatus Micrarchaeota archaeon CG1_02_47_40]|nr:MAG: cysteine protease [Candidatus Micrarchaeota archaeon CG1_02_47_40]
MKFGWLPDLPDERDYTRETPKIKALLKKEKETPSKIDLRKDCPKIFNQGEIGSCTANAAAALLEYHNIRTYKKEGALSRMFIYKSTRDLMQSKGDSGAYIRTTMGALALFGAPPEKYWEYEEKSLDEAPPAFCYSFAQNYQALAYFRLTSLQEIKETLCEGIPAMFGFRVYASIEEAEGGKIPFPEEEEEVLGGHAVMAVGYEDEMKIGGCKGAFIIRNSWGEEWGERGYGYLPYEYLLSGLALDWWALLKAEWVSTEEFGV